MHKWMQISKFQMEIQNKTCKIHSGNLHKNLNWIFWVKNTRNLLKKTKECVFMDLLKILP